MCKILNSNYTPEDFDFKLQPNHLTTLDFKELSSLKWAYCDGCVYIGYIVTSPNNLTVIWELHIMAPIVFVIYDKVNDKYMEFQYKNEKDTEGALSEIMGTKMTSIYFH
jgi:hypothetical protein